MHLERKVERPMATKKQTETDRYLRLDLRPGGEDLKSYVVKRASEESLKRNKQVSATNYIQELIRDDMKANKIKKKSKADNVAELIKELNNNDLSIVENIVNRLLK